MAVWGDLNPIDGSGTRRCLNNGPEMRHGNATPPVRPANRLFGGFPHNVFDELANLLARKIVRSLNVLVEIIGYRLVRSFRVRLAARHPHPPPHRLVAGFEPLPLPETHLPRSALLRDPAP